MHISEGVLSLPILATGGVLTAVGTAIGLKKMDYDRIMSVSILGAAFFVASLIHVPIGPSAVHLVLTGLLGLVLGWAAFPAILIGLFLQALFFQYGGLAVLGVNCFNMAAPAVLCGLVCRKFMDSPYRVVASFIGGGMAVLLAGLLMAVALIGSDQGFVDVATTLLVAHLPVALIEGFLSVFIISFIARVQPDMIGLSPSAH